MRCTTTKTGTIFPDVLNVTKYKNLDGHAGVTAYEIRENGIIVGFDKDQYYLYTEKVTGKENIRKMKQLAKAGRGLSTFISTVIKDRYAAKW